MTKEVQGTKFVNVEIFEEFLKNNLKKYYPENLEIFLDELATGTGVKGLFNEEWNEERTTVTGVCDYELSPFDTVSGCPEIIEYEVKSFTEDDGDSWDDVITF